MFFAVLLVNWRLQGTKHLRNAGAAPQLGQKRLSSVSISLARVGRIGPDRVIHNLRCFLWLYVHRGFQHVNAFLEAVVAILADAGRLG